MYKLVLIRHGESLWNLENRFTGWADVELTATGVEQAKQAGLKLKAHGYDFDLGYTSVLKRAIHTMWHTLDSMDRSWLPVAHHWRLNERHYGSLQGLNKSETAAKYGEDQVKIWRRSYDVPPPALEESDPRNPAKDPRYQLVAFIKDNRVVADALFYTFWGDLGGIARAEGYSPDTAAFTAVVKDGTHMLALAAPFPDVCKGAPP